MNILLADDDEADRLLFTDAFSELEAKTIVTTVNSGTELMEWLGKDNVELPDLLFLDMNMPRKGGLECLKEIRRNEKLKDISIAIYSTSDNEKDMDETFLSGANVFITKPNNYNVLKETLNTAVMACRIYQEKTMDRDNFLLKI